MKRQDLAAWLLGAGEVVAIVWLLWRISLRGGPGDNRMLAQG